MFVGFHIYLLSVTGRNKSLKLYVTVGVKKKKKIVFASLTFFFSSEYQTTNDSIIRLQLHRGLNKSLSCKKAINFVFISNDTILIQTDYWTALWICRTWCYLLHHYSNITARAPQKYTKCLGSLIRENSRLGIITIKCVTTILKLKYNAKKFSIKKCMPRM